MPRRRLILACFAMLISGAAGALPTDRAMFYSGADGAINGYDVVAYFTMGAPTRGRADISVMWKGAIWRFVNLAHRDAFEANPRAFAPQYGGYCAYGVASGHRDATSPEAWAIVNGKLYLIRSRYVRAIWQSEMAEQIARANANWTAILRAGTD